MRNNSLFSKFLLVSLISCFGCSQYDSQNQAYTSKEAIKKGDVVQVGSTVYNFDRFEQFLNNYHNNKSGKIRVTGYTTEGDPIFIDLEVDGENLNYSYDSSNDKYAPKEIVKDVCHKIVTKKKGQRKIEYLATNCSKKNSYSIINRDMHEF